MPISLIASVVNVNGKLGIGKNNDLLVKLKKDTAFFKEITSAPADFDFKNVVVMGRNTWLSLPAEHKPLKGRINIVLSKGGERVGDRRKCIGKVDGVLFMTYDAFCDVYKKTPRMNVFVIGGESIYKLFLQEKGEMKPSTLFITEVHSSKKIAADKFLLPPDDSYRLICYSEEYSQDEFNYRFLKYTGREVKAKGSDEGNFLNLCKRVLDSGSERLDRTKVGTISKFAESVRYDISGSVPLFTTKRMAWKHAIEELLWFLRGDTDVKILQEKGVKIWNGNSSRQFLDDRGLDHYAEGVVGPIYGWQWRHFGGLYSQLFANSKEQPTVGVGIDQIERVIESLKTDPFSRRHLISAWNPLQLEEMALPPCHFAFQFYVTQGSHRELQLSCHVTMRSNDLFLGHPFNAFSYAVLTYLIAMRTGMKPKELVISMTDAHIYKNHVGAVQEQISRGPRPFPKLFIDARAKTMRWDEMTSSLFQVIGYFPHESIKADMAV